MAIFRLNKIIRDKLVHQYDVDGQTASYRPLTKQTHVAALIDKLAEEAHEIPQTGDLEDVVSELADVQQIIDDLCALHGITKDELETERLRKYNKKGGFAGGYFVTTLELADDDKWTSYYRQYPEVFPEVKKK